MKARALFFVLITAPALHAADSPDLQIVTRIRQEGFRNSKVMEIAAGIVDFVGPRLTGSPNMKKANEWTRDKLTELGLANAHLESWQFGRGWSSDYASVRMLSPDAQQLYAIPLAWSPATSGPLRGSVKRVKLETKEDLEKNKGTFGGAILMISEPRELKPQDKAAFERYDEMGLEKLAVYEIPAPRDNTRAGRREFRKALAQFAMDEKIAAIVQVGRGDGGTFAVQSSGTWRDDEPIGVPSVALAPEQYNRIARLLDAKKNVELEVDVHAQFYGEDLNSYNTIAEIPGTDKKGEVVMLGAHLDSWHGSTGATDNAAGCAAMMEAVRILKSLGIAPKRTIRIALWSGEEQGLLGSHGYVAQHFAARTDPKDAKSALIVKPEHAKISAYFNLDNGTGKVRGIYAQENAAVVPIFTSWLEPLHDIGATIVTMRNTQSTDHIAFDDVGVPGFQFVQDEIEYTTRTHHTNWDSYERLQREDLMQAAVVVATVVWEAANRPELLPRKPLPK